MPEVFEKVSNAVSNTANNITDKTKGFIEISAMKGRVRSQKKLVNDLYMEIGRQYYREHLYDEKDHYSASMKKITDLLWEIDELEEDIRNLREK